MIQIIASLVPIVLTNNLVMSIVKYLAFRGTTSTTLRAVLVFLSLVGVFTTAAVDGQDIDLNTVSGLAQAFVEIVGVAIASHLSYKAIKNA